MENHAEQTGDASNVILEKQSDAAAPVAETIVAQTPPPPENSSGQGRSAVIPDGIKGWSWGALLLNWIWAVSNRAWIGLLVFVPYVGILVSFYLGFKGRELAWRGKKWDSVEDFNRVQKSWSKWGVIVTLASVALGIVLGLTSAPPR
jgi:hypothetical protein